MSDMTFVLQREGQAPEIFPLGKFGGESRFSWGEPGRRAALWKVVARPNGEVYVAERTLGSALKISLHKSGDWRFAWIERDLKANPAVKAAIAAAGTRLIDQWTRPSVAPGATFTPAYTIFTTGEDLTPTRDVPSAVNKVRWLPPPTRGQIAFFNIGFMRPDGRMLNMNGQVPIFAAAMKTGEALLVTAARRPFKDEEQADLRMRRAVIRGAVQNPKLNLYNRATPGMRVLTHSQSADGGRWVLDLALHPDSDSRPRREGATGSG